MGKKAYHHHDLDVYQRAFEAAMKIFEVTQSFPKEERYALVDQARRCSRSAAATWTGTPAATCTSGTTRSSAPWSA
jgi:hypothetical protein